MTYPFHLRERMSTVEPKAYKRYGLRNNPFPMSGVAPEHPKMFAARASVYDKVSDFIVRTHISKRWGGLVIIGEYGNGKTHTLKLIRDQIHQELGETPAGKTLAVYVENLGDSLVDFHFNICREVGFSLFVKMLWGITSKAIAKKIDADFIASLRPKEILFVGPKDNDLIKFLVSDSLLKTAITSGYFSKESVGEFVNGILKDITLNSDIRKCCCTILIEEDQETVDNAWRYISGEKLTLAQAKKIGVSKSAIGEGEIQREVFRDLLNVFRKNRVLNIYLLIDEIEDLVPLPDRRKRQILGGLRSIIDNNQDNLAIIFATTTPGWADLKLSSPPLADRFPNLVELLPLNPEQAKELIVGYLSEAREKEPEDPAYPFSEKVIKEIWEVSGGNLRKILELCYQLIERGVKKRADRLSISLLEGITASE